MKNYIELIDHGLVEVTFVRDNLGNLRMIPVSGGMSLDEWRKNPKSLPPWILADDCKDPEEWNKLFHKGFRAITLAEVKLNEEA